MNDRLDDFLRRLKDKKINIAVVGLGYVGLPLAIEFAKQGFPVLGIELDCDRLQNLKKGVSYISDIPSADLKKVISSGKFRVESNFRLLKGVDVVLICVPTPLKRKYSPDISFIKSAVRSLARHLKKGALVVLESTTYPGTTDEVILPILESPGLKHGEDFFLCFSPERIDPGNRKFPLHKIPKVIGGINNEAALRGEAVYQRIINKVVRVSSTRVAETVKLLENTFRLINIGLIDEIAMMAHKLGIDIWEVVQAAATKPFGFMPFYPGPGVGGHCIPKDPLYLYWRAKHQGYKCRFIKLASDTISAMPGYVVSRVEQLLKDDGLAFKNAKVLVVGVTYKKDIKDLRKSPAIDIIECLENRKASVAYHDPLIPYLRVNRINLRSVKLCDKVLSGFDCVVIATDHSGIDYKSLLKNSKFVFDTRNVYKGIKDNKIFRL